tara:strand:+ start:481 stop:915 length:435 start_codon:yes stop_codon:yes gene_type:complete
MTPGEIKDLIDAIYHGTADPDDAKKLLKLFCDCIDNSEPIPDDILGFLKHAFTSVLTEEKTLDKALGLKRKRGTPRRDEEKDTLVALQFLKLLNSGEPHVSARLILAEKLFISEGQIKKCWANYEEEARLLLRIENYLENSSQE